MREHNRISDHLARINSHWDDERLFKESKKIVVAEIQHITYMQWLPRILGKNKFEKINYGTLSRNNNNILKIVLREKIYKNSWIKRFTK